MDPFDDLYGRRCRSYIGWFKADQVVLLGSQLIYLWKRFKLFKKGWIWLKVDNNFTPILEENSLMLMIEFTWKLTHEGCDEI